MLTFIYNLRSKLCYGGLAILTLVASCGVPETEDHPAPVAVTDSHDIREFAVTPDGSCFAYYLRDGSVVKDDRADSTMRVVADQCRRGRMRWTRDGDYLFLQTHIDEPVVQLIPRNQNLNTETIPVMGHFPVLTHDRSQVVYHRDNSPTLWRAVDSSGASIPPPPTGFRAIDIETGSESRFDADLEGQQLLDIILSPTSDWLLCVTARGEPGVCDGPGLWSLWLVSAKEPHTVRNIHRDGSPILSACWSHSGDAVFYPEIDSAAGKPGLFKVIVDTVTGEILSRPILVLSDFREDQFQVCGENDEKLFFIRETRVQDLQAFTLEGDPGNYTVSPRRLTRGRNVDLWCPDISPDGSEVLFAMVEDEEFAVYTIPIEGGELSRVPTSETDCTKPIWSRDGEQIAYVYRLKGEQQKLMAPRIKIMDIGEGDASESEPIKSQSQELMGWFPDDNLIFGGGMPHFLDKSTGSTKPLASRIERTGMNSIHVSPVSDEIAFDMYELGRSGRRGIGIFNFELGYPKMLRTMETTQVLGWSADGEWIHFRQLNGPKKAILGRLSRDGEVLDTLADISGMRIGYTKKSPVADTYVGVLSESWSDVWEIVLGH